MASEQPYVYTIPDLMAGWPFPTHPNVNSERINAESKAWVESYGAFNEKAQNTFNRCNFGAFAARAYPNSPPHHYRPAVDLINYYFVYDELSDEKDGETVRLQAQAIMNAIRNPYAPPPENEHVLGTMARDFWRRTLEDGKASHSTAQRFMDTFEEYTETVRQQAADRDHDILRPSAEYLEMRRGTVGVRPSFDFFVLSDELPNEVLEHPTVASLIRCAIDMSIMSNDIYSFNIEQARGDKNHNLVSVIMAEEKTDIQGAIDHISKKYDELRLLFLHNYKHLPELGDAKLKKTLEDYCLGLGTWVTTNDEWSFITPRYFGDKREEVRRTKKVTLLPRIVPANVFKVDPDATVV
ncbi:terpenoid synthase [Cylindrobasidium torrendii FP15055 ss-10]|uniref:Terpene synthase n=1 Tax=Cylindrobasidium torrendii FP15055 ss-10 TaxID=1314674 RepID=A0A0D7B3G0_9AGAR|nr:terpenoid synthase [Cylindrobasidium torrendii FP15055 ss-10]